MRKLLSAAAVLAIAAGAHAAPFRVISHQSGGGVPGISGPGIFVSNQGFFDSNGNSPDQIGPGSAGDFTVANNNEFDTYIALDGFGPSARGRLTNAVANNSTVTRNFYGDYPDLNNNPAFGDHNAGTGIVGPGSHIGDPFQSGDAATPVLRIGYGLGSNPPHTESGFAPNVGGGRSTLDGVFVGRLTIPANATLSGGITITLRIGLTTGNQPGTLFFSGTDDVPGAPVLIAGELLALTAFLVTTHEAGVLSGNSDDNAFDDFGAARTLDLWVHVIPTPGTLALIGLGGFAAIRRRRA